MHHSKKPSPIDHLVGAAKLTLMTICDISWIEIPHRLWEETQEEACQFFGYSGAGLE